MNDEEQQAMNRIVGKVAGILLENLTLKGRAESAEKALAEAQKQAAAMRDTLDRCAKVLGDLSACSWDETGDDLSGAIGDALEEAIKALESDAGKCYIHEDNLDATNRQIAAMREALHELLYGDQRRETVIPAYVESLCQNAIATNAGRDFVPMADVTPMVESIKLFREMGWYTHRCQHGENLECSTCHLFECLSDWEKKHPAKGPQ